MNDKEEVLKAIDIKVAKGIKSVEDNRTIYGNITAVLGNNQYTVIINNLSYTINAPIQPPATYIVGNIVMIEVVNNDLSHKYIKGISPF